MKNVSAIFLGLSLLGTFLYKPSFFLSSASKSLVSTKLTVSTSLSSAFNDESLHAGIGGTWSAADKGGNGNGNSK
ncbi:MAG TPA: hypothetical protein VNJ08_12185 [Bacteriovoracaceae bacterium]|nr:hypothetical protein [Bacteriovoracaceae bacterium]